MKKEIMDFIKKMAIKIYSGTKFDFGTKKDENGKLVFTYDLKVNMRQNMMTKEKEDDVVTPDIFDFDTNLNKILDWFEKNKNNGEIVLRKKSYNEPIYATTKILLLQQTDKSWCIYTFTMTLLVRDIPNNPEILMNIMRNLPFLSLS